MIICSHHLIFLTHDFKVYVSHSVEVLLVFLIRPGGLVVIQMLRIQARVFFRTSFEVTPPRFHTPAPNT